EALGHGPELFRPVGAGGDGPAELRERLGVEAAEAADPDDPYLHALPPSAGSPAAATRHATPGGASASSTAPAALSLTASSPGHSSTSRVSPAASSLPVNGTPKRAGQRRSRTPPSGSGVRVASAPRGTRQGWWGASAAATASAAAPDTL